MRRRTQPTTEPHELIPYVWSYGMGAESTAGIYRMLTEPSGRPDTIAPDFNNLVVVVAQTGDEWTTTGALVEQHILPVLSQNHVRFVELARQGPTKKDGIAVLQDTRRPRRLHLAGVYKLSDENRTTGTMPQLGGVRKCSQKAKGAPQDAWRDTEFGEQSYYHALGFNRDEYTRIARDSAYSMGGNRLPNYPIYEWNWSRQDCIDYLYRKLGVVWPKSCCRHCPYAGSRAGWAEQLARFQTLPDEAVQHVIDEYVCLALNPRSGLFGPGQSLITRLARDHATDVLKRAAARMKIMPWAVYRVRRRYSAPAHAVRAVYTALVGDRRLMVEALGEISELVGVRLVRHGAIPGAPQHGDTDSYWRLWLRRRSADVYPAIEEFYVVAPAQANDKATSTFESTWAGHVDALLARQEHDAEMALTLIRRAVTRLRSTDAAA
jgi:hypothetical protein